METETRDPLVRPFPLLAAALLGCGIMWALNAATRPPDDEMVVAAALHAELAEDLGEAPSTPGPASRERALAQPVTAEGLAAALATVREMAARGNWDALRTQALFGADARVRIAAMRALAEGFGRTARGTLLTVAQDAGSSLKVRAEAARCVGDTGAGAERALERLLDDDVPLRVRAGAAEGLARAGSHAAVTRLVELADHAPARLAAAAATAVAEVRGEDALPVLLEAAGAARHPAVRAAACRALASFPGDAAAARLQFVLADPLAPPQARAAAADALGRSGRVEARTLVAETAATAESRVVALAARRAETWLDRDPAH